MMLRLSYSIIAYFLIPVVLLRLLWRSRNNQQYRYRWKERFGFFKFPLKLQNAIWIHAVSVGEVFASLALIKSMRKQYPEKSIIVTTTTPTGSERVKLNLPKDIFHVYAPYDIPLVIKRFLKKVRPCIAIFMETELWPNTLYYCHKNSIPVIIANARISKKSIRGYQRFQSVTTFMLKHINCIAAQSELDAQRYLTLGASPDIVHTVGNLKFDADVPASLLESAEIFRQQVGLGKRIWVGASTHDGEDEELLKAHKAILKTFPDALLILVPRHPERFEKVFQLCKKQGFSVQRRSHQSESSDVSVFVGDTMGELRLFFAVSEVAFVGGSFVAHGGHNLLEPAMFSCPVLSGPETFNFVDIQNLLLQFGGLRTVHNASELSQMVIELFSNPSLRTEMGKKAKRVVDKNKGAIDRHMRLIGNYLSHSSVRDI